VGKKQEYLKRITDKVEQISNFEPDSKCDPRSKADRCLNQPCENTDHGRKKVYHGGRRTRWAFLFVKVGEQ
jgi:hypothetical protein